MTAMKKGIATLAAVAALAAAGCGGYDEEEARAACDALVSRVDTSGSAAYQQCIACHEECGDGCAVLESFPPQFSCQD